ncbi:MAG: 50S ribosomal protein L13 [bacterium]|nr:50S ribosomal protein L13 [bacterium]
MERETHTIDATDQILGRLATRIAVALRGKHRPSYQPHIDQGDFVVVQNASKLKVSGKKMSQKKYYRHSGFLGGIKEKPLSKAMEQSPINVLNKAVWGMLPKNKLRAIQIKRLKIEA